MTRRLTLLILGFLLLASPLPAQQEDLKEKIRELEQKIEELKALEAQVVVRQKKTDQCLKAVGREKFCDCLGDNLPASVSFEQYVHTLVTSKEELGYGEMTPEEKEAVDATLETREKCVEKGLFK